MKGTTVMRQMVKLTSKSKWKRQPWSLLDAMEGTKAIRSVSTQQFSSQDDPNCWTLIVTAAVLAASVYQMPRETTQCESPTRKSKINRTDSLRGGISLEDKYNIEWEIILGEGAYGSVHPARLAATGEKVGTQPTNPPTNQSRIKRYSHAANAFFQCTFTF